MGKNPRIGTIGDLPSERCSLHSCCENHRCARSAKVASTALVRERGASYPLQRALERARCLKSGTHWPKVSLIAPPNDTGGFKGRSSD